MGIPLSEPAASISGLSWLVKTILPISYLALHTTMPIQTKPLVAAILSAFLGCLDFQKLFVWAWLSFH